MIPCQKDFNDKQCLQKKPNIYPPDININIAKIVQWKHKSDTVNSNIVNSWIIWNFHFGKKIQHCWKIKCVVHPNIFNSKEFIDLSKILYLNSPGIKLFNCTHFDWTVSIIDWFFAVAVALAVAAAYISRMEDDARSLQRPLKIHPSS